MLKKSLYICLLLFAMFVIGFAFQKTAEVLHLPLDLTANKGAGQILLYGIVIGCILWFTYKVWKHDPQVSAAPYFKDWNRIRRGFWLCAGVSLALQVPVYGILFSSGMLHVSDYARHKHLPVLIFNIVISQIVMVVLATSEEGIYRGFLFSYLRGKSKTGSIIVAAVLSSIIFALSHEFHTLNHWLEPAYFGKLIGLFLLGILLATTYQSTRSLACSIGVHASLLWLDEIRRQAMDPITSHWWSGTNNDLRTAPFVWLIFLVLTAFFAVMGKRLRPALAIEDTEESDDEVLANPIPDVATTSTVTPVPLETVSSTK